MTGFWSAESSALTSDTANSWLYNKLGATATWDKDLIGIAEKGIAGGAVSRFGGKLFSAGFFPGAGAAALSDGILGLESLVRNPEKPLSVNAPVSPSANAPVNAGFKLLQPKIGRKGVTYPLNSVSGGTWARGAPWGALY